MLAAPGGAISADTTTSRPCGPPYVVGISATKQRLRPRWLLPKSISLSLFHPWHGLSRLESYPNLCSTWVPNRQFLPLQDRHAASFPWSPVTSQALPQFTFYSKQPGKSDHTVPGTVPMSIQVHHTLECAFHAAL